jgi:hypothetical protein
MNNKVVSIRPFIGAKDHELSRSFYRDLGFEEVLLSVNMSLFKNGSIGFYLQKSYVKDWIDNTMIFVEVEDVESYWQFLFDTGPYKKISKCKAPTARVQRMG